MGKKNTCYKIIVEGLVQGIGYRPFVAELAESLGIKGNVRNTFGIVTIEAEDGPNFDTFVEKIKTEVPPGGHIDRVTVEEMETFGFHDFRIVTSDGDGADIPPVIPVDLATCPECEAELFDECNRRFRHPFISCVHCGPRYTIINELPYDRNRIVMDKFPMCTECETEYTTKADRRRHAQTIACKNCGPVVEGQGNSAFDSPKARILAIKDIGGFHLACDPRDSEAVEALRRMKGRELKPFAVMFPTISEIEKVCLVSEKERELLGSVARPIVLLDRKYTDDFADSVCGNSPYMGAFLPSNPIQLMLMRDRGVLVMTSANDSGGLMITEGDAMRQWLSEHSGEAGGISIEIIDHDRGILVPLDDSVVRVVRGRTIFVRRARGYVPEYIPTNLNKKMFVAGGDLKSVFAYVKAGRVYPGPQLGDLEDTRSRAFYKLEQLRMEKLFGFDPEDFACDLHPAYESRNLCKGKNAKVFEVQHHLAHILSIICEHNIKGKVLGVAFDGTGYGTDGSIWGGEFISVDGQKAERIRHLRTVSLAGGDLGAKSAELSMYGYLAGFGRVPEAGYFDDAKLMLTEAAVNANLNRVKSSSMGRLFDAVSALLGVCTFNHYEGEAPCELEYAAAGHKGECELAPIDPVTGDTEALFMSVGKAMAEGVSTEDIAYGFHMAVAEYILAVAKDTGIKQVVLGGGTFLNRILLDRTIELLEKDGFEVYTNNRVPVGDGGICLGQAYALEHEIRLQN